MKKAIITGATGVIGRALVNTLVDEHVFVTLLCHRNSVNNSKLPKSHLIHVVECDLDELECGCKELTTDYDVFYHFGWSCTTGSERNNVEAQINNIQYTLKAVEAAHKLGCSRFIGAGSQAEYGRFEGKLTALTPTFPENGYGIAKLCAGNLSRIRCEQLGVEHIWTRILSVYGPYDGENTLVSSLIRDFQNGIKPKCTKGEQIWDYIYSKDIANAFYLLGEKGIHGKTYVIGSGEARPLSEYIYAIRDLVNPNIEIGFGDIPYADKQVMYLCADIEELVKDTGFSVQYSFEKGISDLLSIID